MKTVKTLLIVAALGGLAGLGVLYSGLYPMGADVPHNRLTYWALETLRERSIARAIRTIDVPLLDDSGLLLAGGEDYNEMCTDCHLKPGKTESEFTLGLYPQTPNLAMSAKAHHHAEASEGGGHGDPKTSAARQFWIIKHGIKASGMAAFGATHDDGRIWAMVAFLQKLPTLTPAQYQILTARSSVEPSEDPAGSPAAHAAEASGHEGHSH
ncbi:cytochrome c [uncultured Nevskia sp.]|uniref:c-type cytochrome n=1 Tax=uncultured Nevskia sp. TaxID=228950 RepID=UPI0025D456F4|nr:cytochrome c [uncultured Nevskia sp.]